MKNYLLSLFVTNYGAIIRWLASLAVGVIVTAATRANITLTDEQATQLLAAVTAATSGIVGELLLRWQGKSIKEIQTSLQPINSRIAIDQWAGPQTKATVAKASETIQNLTAPRSPQI